MEDELLHGKTDYTADNTKAANTDTLAPKKLSFDDFDLDALPSVVEPNTTVTLQDAANTATVSQPVPSQTTDNTPPQPIAPQSSNESNDKKIIETIEAIEAIETTPPVVLTKTKPEIKRLSPRQQTHF